MLSLTDVTAPAQARRPLESLIEAAVRGGWPEGGDLPLAQAMRIPRNYIDRLVTEDMTRLDEISRDPSKVRATLESIARNNATLVLNSTIQRDVDAGGQTISRDTVAEYLSALRRLYVLDEIPAWSPKVRSQSRLRSAKKRLLADPSLAIAALRLTPERLLEDLQAFGFMFEAMCLRDLLVYAGTLGATLHHYLDDSGLDADAIVELPDGAWLGIEIKLGHNQVDAAAAKLLRLSKKLQGKGARPPVCLVVVSGLSGFSKRREDGVYVTPLDCLGP